MKRGIMATRSCEQYEEMGALMAIGADAPDERQIFEQHLAEGCLHCAAAQKNFLETAYGLVRMLPVITPPPGVRIHLLDAIDRERAVNPAHSHRRPSSPSRTDSAWSWLWPAAGWALATALVLALLWSLNIQQNEVRRHSAEVAELRRLLDLKDSDLKLVEARHTQTVGLKGLAAAPQTSGRVFWNPETNTGLLIVFDLPVLPAGRVYQLWAIPQGEKPVGAGTFAPDPQGRGSLKVPPLPDTGRPVQVFAITDEPAGGSSQPTGTMVLQGAPILS